jgi:hypothetical protein
MTTSPAAPDSQPAALIHALSANAEQRIANAPTAALARIDGINRGR